MTTDVDTSAHHDSRANQSLKMLLLRRAERMHLRMKGIRQVPLPAIGVILLIMVINLIIWAVAGIVLVSFHAPYLSRKCCWEIDVICLVLYIPPCYPVSQHLDL